MRRRTARRIVGGIGVIVAYVALGEIAIAQNGGAARPSASAAAQDAQRRGEPSPPTPPDPSPWSVYTTLSSGFASNIHFDLEDRDAYGAVLGGGVRFEGDDFAINYEIARHSYTDTSRWNRFSHLIAASVERDLPGNWEFDTEGQIGFKGSSEDRDIVDQDLEISPRLAYRFSAERRLRLFTTHRLKRYNDDPDSNAFKNYFGAEFRETLSSGRHWEFGGRFETNDEPLDRGDYRRFTYWLEHGLTVTPRDSLLMQVRYRLKRYTARLIEVEDEDVLRVDHRWVPSVSWIRTIGPKIDVRVDYSYESNYSNDFDKEYGAHLAWTGLAVRW